jgi:hypothetical protein
MRALEDFVEYLVLGSIAFLCVAFAGYVVSPSGIVVLLEWVQATPASLGAIVPFVFFLGLIFHHISYAINRPLVHRRLFKRFAGRFEQLPSLCDSVRGAVEQHWAPYSESERLEARVGDALEWCRFFLFQHGSDELRKQNLRVFYMYRVSYGCLSPLLLCIGSGVAGLFLPGCDRYLCAFALAVAGVLLVGAYVSIQNNLKMLWRYLAYSAEVLIQERRDEIEFG